MVKLQNGDTALILAASERGNDGCVKMLVDAGADVNVQNKVRFDFGQL